MFPFHTLLKSVLPTATLKKPFTNKDYTWIAFSTQSGQNQAFLKKDSEASPSCCSNYSPNSLKARWTWSSSI